MNKQEETIKLTKEELQILINVLLNSRWTVSEVQSVIIPLINKLSTMIDQADK
jgi:hypothetical protein